MAEVDTLYLTAELNKLRKNELIDLIVLKKLPQTVNSDVLVKLTKQLGEININKCKKCQEFNETLPNTKVKSGDGVKTVMYENNMEVEYLKEIIKQKELVIDNQMIATTALQKHIDLLNKLLNKEININNSLHHNKVLPSHGTINKGDTTNKRKTIKDVNTAAGMTSTGKIIVENSNTNCRRIIDSNEASVALHQAAAQLKMNEIISLNLDNESSKSLNKNKILSPSKRNTKTIVGSNSNSNGNSNTIKAAPNMKYFHVSRVDPSTTTANMLQFLKGNFMNVSCTQLKSKHPDEYSSFKVGVSAENVDKLLEPTRWAQGIKISKFFHFTPRQMTVT